MNEGKIWFFTEECNTKYYRPSLHTAPTFCIHSFINDMKTI